VRILLSKMREDIESIFIGEVVSLENVDLEETVNAIENHANEHGLFCILSWQDSEKLALLVLDWIGMHEAIWKLS